MKIFNNFSISLLTLSLILFLAGYFFFSNSLYNLPVHIFSFILLYFIITTYISHRILINAAKERFAKFSSYFMAITGLRMFINIIVITIFVYLNQKIAFLFLITFLVSYFAYTIFEVVSLLKYFKNKSEPPTIVVH